jgi:hypothetical protein
MGSGPDIGKRGFGEYSSLQSPNEKTFSTAKSRGLQDSDWVYEMWRPGQTSGAPFVCARILEQRADSPSRQNLHGPPRHRYTR